MKTIDLYLGVVPTLVTVASLHLALLFFWLTDRYDADLAEETGHNFWRQFYYWVLSPLIRGLDRLGATPNHVTYFSLLLAFLSAAALATQHFYTTFSLLLISCSCDVADGMLARWQGSSSEAGAFLDSFMDRVVEGVLFLGVAIAGGGGILSWVAMATMVASFTVSYARAKGESLGVVASMGFMGRPARLVSLIFIVLFVALFDSQAIGYFATAAAHQAGLQWFFAGMLSLVGLGAMHTTILRALHIYKELPQPEVSVSMSHSNSVPSQGRILPKATALLGTHVGAGIDEAATRI